MTRLMHLTTVDMSLELLLGHQMRAARDAGYRVTGVSAPGPWVAALEADGIRHIALASSTRGWNLAADLRAATELWRILRRERPDVLHTHNPKPGLYGRVLGRWAGVPVVVNTVHGLYAAPDAPLLKRAVVYLAEAVASRFSDHELVQSAEDTALMRRLHLVPRNRLTHLGNGVDLAHFDPGLVTAGEVASLRAELGLMTGRPVVGAVGRLVAEKGWPELFTAARALWDRGEAFSLIVIGPADEDKADALAPAELERARGDGVRFLGLRRDMRQLYGLMDLFVLPSHREGFPRAAMEAAAMGVPIVATDIRGCREVVEDGANGLLVPAKAPEPLAAAMECLLQDGERRRVMGAAGRALAAERFDARKVARTVLDTYQKVADQKGIPLLVEPGLAEKALPRDAGAIASLHGDSITSGFLASLGPGVLTQIYRGLIADPAGLVLVVRNPAGEPVGFVAGSADTAAFYRRTLRRRSLPLGLAALPALAAHPARLRRMVETLRYPSSVSTGLPAAELLAMAVSEPARSRGLGAVLVGEFLARLGAPAVRVVVGAGNEGARRFYRSQGFNPVEERELHSGQRSEVLVWRSS